LTYSTMKPDRLNGQDILRPVVHEGGTPKLASSSVWFPPTISVQHAYEPLGRLVEIEAQQIVAMKAMKTSELKQRLYAFAQAVIANEQRKPLNG